VEYKRKQKEQDEVNSIYDTMAKLITSFRSFTVFLRRRQRYSKRRRRRRRRRTTTTMTTMRMKVQRREKCRRE